MSINMSYLDEKNGRSVYSASPVSPNQPMSATSRMSGISVMDLEKEDKTFKNRIRIFRLMSRILALILNGFMVGVESYALSRYYLTRNHLIAGNASPWVTPATLWPTFLLLGMSVVTFLLNIITICAYACGVGASNKINSCTTVINYIFLGVQVVLWGITVGLFKMANNGNDLWGYSCSDQADQIQAEVRSFLDFGKLCTMQGAAWKISIVQAVSYLVTFVTLVLMFRRMSHQKKLKNARGSLSAEAAYNQSPDVGTSYNPSPGRQYLPVAMQSPHF